MHVDDIRKILMLQAFEEKNGGGDFFSEAEILSANSASGAPLDRRASRADEDAFLAKRADILLRRLRSRSPEATRWIDQIPERFPAGALAAGLGIIAALAGFFTNELGPEKRINILSFPLLGILLWSAIIYLREIFLFFRGSTAETVPVWLESLGERLKSRHEASDAATDSFKNARLLFEKRWFLLSAPLPVARLKSMLHATAFILAASAVGGMYVKGLANEYRAVWESTFFTDGRQLRPFLELVLGPAAALCGSSLPVAPELNAMQWPSEGENAARWIHWYAITIGLFVLLPRAALALVWRLRANRLARTLPFREVSPFYFERLLSTSTGASLPLRLVPYAFSPDAACRGAAAEQLERQFGRAVTLHPAPAISFGEEETVTLAPLGGDVENAEIVPLFHFAATPELETHLTVYETLSGLSPKPVRYVLLDTTTFDRKSMTFSDAQVRREGRRAAWERLFEGKNITIIPFSASSALTPS